MEKPDTLAGAEKALKKHEDFLTTMGANEEKVEATLQTGQRLLDAENLYAGKVKDKMTSIAERSGGQRVIHRCFEGAGGLVDSFRGAGRTSWVWLWSCSYQGGSGAVALLK